MISISWDFLSPVLLSGLRRFFLFFFAYQIVQCGAFFFAAHVLVEAVVCHQ